MSMLNNTMKSRDDAYVCCDPLERRRVTTPVVGESKTRQAAKQACDVNHIVDKFSRTGVLPPPRHQGAYADVTGLQGELTEKVSKSRKDLSQYSSDLKTARAKRKAKEADASKTAAKAPTSDDGADPT